MKKILSLLLFTAAGLTLFSPKAHAYLDPGSGSLLIQLIVAGLIGASMTIKIYWQKISSFFAKPKKSGKDDSPKS